MPQHFKTQSKRILYTIRKRTNGNSKELCFGRIDKISSIQRTLSDLKKKGFLFQDNSPLRGISSKAVYWLTPKGIKVADEIVKEIDEYKKW